MKKYPKFVQLKNREQVMIRLMVPEDEKMLLEFFKKIPEDDRLVLRNDTTDPRVIKRWVNEIDYDKVFPVIAEHRGKIIGDATLHMKQYGWQRHVGEIRIVIAKEFRGKGLGKVLIHELLEKAAGVGLHHIQLSLVETQVREIKIFERMGFKKVATLPKYIIDVTGLEHDLIIMTTRVSEIWKKLEELIQATEIDIIRGIQ
jgi:L-amino acid N-acyltransferase YncA